MNGPGSRLAAGGPARRTMSIMIIKLTRRGVHDRRQLVSQTTVGLCMKLLTFGDLVPARSEFPL